MVEHNFITACLIFGSEISLKLLGRRDGIIIRRLLGEAESILEGNLLITV